MKSLKKARSSERAGAAGPSALDDVAQRDSLMAEAFVIGRGKWIVLNLVSMGLFASYWHYRQHKLLKRMGMVKGPSILLAIFSPLTSNYTFPALFKAAQARGFKVPGYFQLLAPGWMLFSAATRLPEPYGYLSVLALVVPVAATKAVDAIRHSIEAPRQDSRLTPWAIVWVVVGFLALVATILGQAVTEFPTETGSTGSR